MVLVLLLVVVLLMLMLVLMVMVMMIMVVVVMMMIGGRSTLVPPTLCKYATASVDTPSRNVDLAGTPDAEKK
eukprot:SAG31_NODE_31558_length_366_cov_2.756554_1_plen_72_part_01